LNLVSILSTPTLDPAIWAAAGIGVGGFLFYRGFGLLQRKRLILNTPRSTVRSAAIGPVEVSGKAVGPYTLISPLSVLNCYYYRAIAWQNQGRGWRKSAEEVLYAPLFIDDGTGHLLIDPRGAEMDIPAPFSHEYDGSDFSGEFMPDYITHFLHRHGLASDGRLKLEEECILPGDAFFALGTLQENRQAHSMAAYVSEGAADLQRRGALECLDRAAGEALASAKEINSADQFDLQPEVILAKGPGRNPFFISWCSEREVVLTTAWRAFLYLGVGPILVLICLWLLIRPDGQ
jgi:hypothetical protein